MSKLHALLAGPRAAATDPEQEELQEDDPNQVDDSSTLYIYDVIGGWDGVTSAKFARALDQITTPRIELRINSPGGDVFEARAIKTAIERHPANVTAVVDGLAASSASFVMLGADEIKIAAGAFVMIHNPWTFAIGDAAEMRRSADLLDQVAATIRADYVKRTGMSDADVGALMDAETWLEANDAVEKGFCDCVMEPSSKAKNLKRFDLSAYARAPKALLEAPRPSNEEILAASLQAARARQEKRLRLYEKG